MMSIRQQTTSYLTRSKLGQSVGISNISGFVSLCLADSPCTAMILIIWHLSQSAIIQAALPGCYLPGSGRGFNMCVCCLLEAERCDYSVSQVPSRWSQQSWSRVFISTGWLTGEPKERQASDQRQCRRLLPDRRHTGKNNTMVCTKSPDSEPSWKHIFSLVAKRWKTPFQSFYVAGPKTVFFIDIGKETI